MSFKLFHNKKGGLEDAIDMFAGFVILLLLVVVFLLLFVGGDKKQDVVFKKNLYYMNAENELNNFLESTYQLVCYGKPNYPPNTPILTFFQDLNEDTLACIDMAATVHFDSYFIEKKKKIITPDWSLVILDEATDETHRFGSNALVSKGFFFQTVAETYIPTKNGLVKVYLQYNRNHAPTN